MAHQQKQNICLPTNVLFLVIQAVGLVYHHDAVVDIIKPQERYTLARDEIQGRNAMLANEAYVLFYGNRISSRVI